VKDILILHYNSVSHRKVSRISEEDYTKVQILLVPVVRDSHLLRVCPEVPAVLQDPALLDNQEGRVYLALLFHLLAL
jgi:hypothetical protein